MKTTCFLVTCALLASCADSDPSMTGMQPSVEMPALSFVDRGGQDVASIYYLDPVVLRLRGLRPGTSVVIESSMAPWQASATFTVAADGTVDTGRDAPSAGTYDGVDADGLFWSMNTDSFEYAKSADVSFAVKDERGPLLSRTLKRTVAVPGSRVVIADSPGLVARLILPPGQGPFPAVLAFGGSEGGIGGGLGYAEELVPQGYAVLALAYFAEPGLPEDLKEIPLEYFDGALDWLERRSDVDPTRLGVIGGSRGGELALLLAARRPDLKAAVADAPSVYVWGSADGTGAAWTDGGKPLPQIGHHGNGGEIVSMPNGDTAVAYTPMFLADVAAAAPDELEAARIKVETATASIAMFGGADDQLWPSCVFAKAALEKLSATGHLATHPADASTCFDEAGHLVSSVGLPTTWSSFITDPLGQSNLALGGTPRGTAHAGRARQDKLRAFFAATLLAP
jgi:pimeloyl-ACP methyl ester carboxylesterase